MSGDMGAGPPSRSAPVGALLRSLRIDKPQRAIAAARGRLTQTRHARRLHEVGVELEDVAALAGERFVRGLRLWLQLRRGRDRRDEGQRIELADVERHDADED